MSTILSVLLGLSILVVIAVFGAFILVAIRFFVFFHWRSCKHCGHNMIYRGLKDDNENGHYLFHCPKCGAWEQLPKEEFFRQCNPPEDNNK